MTKAIQKATEQKTMRQYIQAMEGEIARALPSVITPERFTRITLTALSRNPQLQECTPASFLGAMMMAAQLGLEPNTPLGQAYLIPYRNHGVMECQFQIGYKGLIDLAYRSGEIESIEARAVYRGDTFGVEYGLQPKLEHRPNLDGDHGEAICYYAIFRTKSGGYGFDVMSAAEVLAYAQKYSKSIGGESTPWKTDFDAMAKKTVLKRLLKYAPLKTDFLRQTAADGTVQRLEEDGEIIPEPIPAEAEVSSDEQ